LIRSDKFQKFDYKDEEKNKKAYGKATPPEMDVSLIDSVPIYMMSGRYDRIVNINMNKRMAAKIPAV